MRHSELDWVERFFSFSSPADRGLRQRLYSASLRERVALDSSLDMMRALASAQPTADALNRVLCLDIQTYMVDDLLAVADRVSMAVSLEVRVPFLDHLLVEFMASVPARFKIRRLEKKYCSNGPSPETCRPASCLGGSPASRCRWPGGFERISTGCWPTCFRPIACAAMALRAGGRGIARARASGPYERLGSLLWGSSCSISG